MPLNLGMREAFHHPPAKEVVAVTLVAPLAYCWPVRD